MKSRCSSYTFVRLATEVPKLCPFFEILICTYRESVAIIFHSFQVINMIFFMCWLLWQRLRRDRDIFITMNDSSLFDIQNSYYLQQAFELFENGSWVFQNSFNPGASGGLWPHGPLTMVLPWTHCGPCNLLSSSVIFRFSSLANFHPCIFHLVCIWKLFNAFRYLTSYMFFC